MRTDGPLERVRRESAASGVVDEVVGVSGSWLSSAGLAEVADHGNMEMGGVWGVSDLYMRF